jgi:hypothetical protein
VETTQEANVLFFSSVDGSLGTTTFTSDGIFGDDEHTLSEGRLVGGPFSVELQPGGIYFVPPGVGDLITTGELDGDRLSLSLTSVSLGGIYDEAMGLFTMTGQVEAEGADLTLDVDFVLDFINRPPSATASGDTIVECDSTDLTGAAWLSGTGSFDFDGPDDIGFYTWYVDDTEAAMGENVTVPIPLGQHVVTLVVADQRGSFDDDTLNVQAQDTTAPGIGITEPRPIEYAHSETIVLDYQVGDTCTGVDTVTPLLDGAGMIGGHGLDDGQAIDLLTELALGQHTFSIDAMDVEGNSSSSSVTFFIVVTPESIQQAVRQFVESGAIQQPSEGKFLLGRLGEAADAYHGGNCEAARGIYGSFIQTVEALTGNNGSVTIDSTAAAILIADAEFLIDNCPQLFGG